MSWSWVAAAAKHEMSETVLSHGGEVKRALLFKKSQQESLTLRQNSSGQPEAASDM